ncbi:hypothetical protein [Rhodopseudomonas sp. RCAM05734]|uniref:hypothetical protein n=1 Tax=Rhodopseudomonas sp. RCAM05734 TaxID=3457549 RepID=UPI0040448A26
MLAWLNTNTRTVTVDLDRAEDVAKVLALLMQNDLLLDARPPTQTPASLPDRGRGRDGAKGGRKLEYLGE